MKRLLEVREFDKISCNPDFKMEYAYLPEKVFRDLEEFIEETKRVFLRMLRSMKDFPSKVFNDANLKMDRMTLYEIFINMYLQEVRTLVKHGIKSAYVAQEDNLKFYKGKLMVNEQIKQNVAHGERFYQ